MFRRAFAILPVLLGLVALASLGACRTAADEPVANPNEPSIRAESGLGAPCTPGGSVDGVDPCGTKQRVAVRFLSHRMGTMAAQSVPCTLSRPMQPKEPTMGGSAVSSCITEGTLYAELECMFCRVPGAGESVVAKLDELTTGQAIAVQGRLGLPTESALRSEKQWRQALSAREAHASR